MPTSSLFKSWAGKLTHEELAQDLVAVASDLGVSLPKGRGVRRLWGPVTGRCGHVNFALKRGETIGVMGRNGSGKSTLLRTLAGIISSDEGSLRFAPNLDCVILAPGAGFDNDLTGRENLYASALFHGHLPEVVRPRADDIIAFSEIGEWADEPVGIYSAGMRARLGFSLSLFMPSDVLMIDETLSAGDGAFREKAREAILSLVNSGRTVIVVSHNVDMMRSMCTRGIVLDAGKQIASGDIEEMIVTYQDRTAARADRRGAAAGGSDAESHVYKHIDFDEKVATLARTREEARIARRAAYTEWMRSEQTLADASAALISIQQDVIAYLRTHASDEATAEFQDLETRLKEAGEAEAAAKTERAALNNAFIRARSDDESLQLDLKQLRGAKATAPVTESDGDANASGRPVQKAGGRS